MSIEVMKLALEALETCRIRSVSEWSVEDITPKNVTAAIAALRTAIQQAEAQQPVTPEPVLFIHPSTFAMNNSHVGAWKPGHELPGYIPLYTNPAPSVPDSYEKALVALLE